MILDLLRGEQRKNPGRWTKVAADIRGVSEETTTGVHRLYEMTKAGTLRFPAINVNDSVTKSKFDNLYGCRHSIVDGLNRATDVMLAGKVAVVLRLRRRGQGLRPGAQGPGRPGRGHRDRPDLRAAGGDGGLPGHHARRRRRPPRTSSSRRPATRTSSRSQHMSRMKDKAIVGNIGHFDNEIEIAGLKRAGVKRINIKPQYDEFVFPDGHSVLILAEGRLLNLGCATGHPSFVMSSSFTNQVLAQLDLHLSAQGKPTLSGTRYSENRVYTLPKKLDEKVARLHLAKLGVKLTELRAGAGGSTSACRWRGRTSRSTIGTSGGAGGDAELKGPRAAGVRRL